MAALALPDSPRSLWLDPGQELGRPPLAVDLEVDACVLGGGIVGLTTALELQRGGRSVAVLDQHAVGEGVTGHSTAKLSSLQGTTYSELERRFGRKGAAAYAALNEGAIGYIVDRVGVLDIDCDLRRRPHALYAWDADQLRHLEREAAAAARAGLDVHRTDDLGLPFPIAGALVREDQAELHIRAYVLGLARAVLDGGGQIFEQTTATHVTPFPPTARPTVTTRGGASVRAHDVIVATHYPFLDRGGYFARLSPKRSYAVAVRGASPLPEVMAISIGAPTRSLRVAPDPHRTGEELLIVGGEGHNAGEQGDRTDDRYRALADFAQEHFGAAEVTHHWSAHDMTTADGLPYAGPLTPLSRHVWVASGFRKWGLTNGTAAAHIIAARILGRTHVHGDLFDTARFTPLRSAPGLAKEGLKDARHFLGDRLRRPDGTSLDLLEPGGDGMLLELDGELVAASRDPDGTTHAVSPVCTHLGCRVGWNRAERSWDCPCHGSRFGPDGTVLQGPAVEPLAGKAAVVRRTAPVASGD
jgi:glycine/D-amino acid oxidase-like deaminating enzyme/nitrite reductase/ring-hydroxylating ferredoxin subunit